MGCNNERRQFLHQKSEKPCNIAARFTLVVTKAAMQLLNLRFKSIVTASLVALVSFMAHAVEPVSSIASPKCEPKRSQAGTSGNRTRAPSPITVNSADPNQTIAVYCSESTTSKSEKSASTPRDDNELSPWLDFWSKVIAALSWPIVAGFAAWRIAPHLQGKLKDLTKVKAGPVEAEFARQVEELRKEVDEKVPEARAVRTFSDDEGRLLELARVSPRSAVIEAWRAVEHTAMKAVELRLNRRDQSLNSSSMRTQISTSALGRELGLLEILNGQQVSLFHELRTLRNKATHAEDFVVDFESVNNYIQLAQSLRQTLEAAERAV